MLPRITIILFLVITTACSDKAIQNQSHESWSLNSPKLISKENGVQYSLKELEVKRPTKLMSSDILFFPSLSEGIRMDITSVCNLETARAQVKLDIQLTEQVALSEILPIKARLKGHWVCSFQFVAKHPNGSEHFFELNQYIIQDDSENSIRIVEDPSSHKPISRFYGNLADNTYVINNGIGPVQLQCGETNYHTDQIKKSLRISDLVPDSELPKDQSVLCRAFETNSEGRVIASSQKLWRTPGQMQIESTELWPKRRTYKDPQFPGKRPHISWGLKNHSKKPVYIALKRKLEPELFSIMTYYKFKFSAEKFYLPIYFHSDAKELKTISEYIVYEVPARAYIELELGTNQRWYCGVWEHGFYVSSISNKLEALVLYHPDKIDEDNIIQKLELNFIGEKWVGLSEPARDHNGGTTSKPFGPRDEHGTLPVRASFEKRVHCRIY